MHRLFSSRYFKGRKRVESLSHWRMQHPHCWTIEVLRCRLPGGAEEALSAGLGNFRIRRFGQLFFKPGCVGDIHIISTCPNDVQLQTLWVCLQAWYGMAKDLTMTSDRVSWFCLNFENQVPIPSISISLAGEGMYSAEGESERAMFLGSVSQDAAETLEKANERHREVTAMVKAHGRLVWLSVCKRKPGNLVELCGNVGALVWCPVC